MTEAGRHVRVLTDSSADSLSPLRATVSEILDSWGLSSAAADVVLVIEEMVLNCGTHVGGDASIDLRAESGTIRVEVVDAGPNFRLRAVGPHEQRYGLRIIDSIASRWGVDALDGSDTGKVVWAEFDRPGSTTPPA